MGAFTKASDRIDRARGPYAYYLRTELGRFAEAVADIDLGLFDVVHGKSEEHGEFDLFALRIPDLMHEWLILPDGHMFHARLTRDNPDVVDLDTFEHPDDGQLVNDQFKIIKELSRKFEFEVPAQ